MTRELHPEDEAYVKRCLRRDTIPRDVLDQYNLEMQWWHGPIFGEANMLRLLITLGYKPAPISEVIADQKVNWRYVKEGVPIVVNSPDHPNAVAVFMGMFSLGIVSARFANSPETREVYAKYVRLATEKDDLTGLTLDVSVSPEEAERDYEAEGPSCAEFNRRVTEETMDDPFADLLTKESIGKRIIADLPDDTYEGMLDDISEDGMSAVIAVDRGGRNPEYMTVPLSKVFLHPDLEEAAVSP
jgi:hypothetical protein